MIAIHCALCGTREKTRTIFQQNFRQIEITSATFSARRTPDRIHYRIVQCLRCTLIFSTPILPNEKILTFYKKSDFFYDTESKYLAKTYVEILQKASPNLIKKNLKLLDIGCGNGFFLEEVIKLGLKDVWGVEPGAASVEKASKKIKPRIKADIFKNGLFPKNSFDLVCCFHTLDHIVDPNMFLRNVYSVLKPGGSICFVVHDTDGLSVKLFGEKSPIFDIEHVYLFNKRSLTGIFKKNGFRDIKTFSVINKYPFSYWLRMSPFPKAFKDFALRTLGHIGLLGIPIRIPAGNIGIIARKN